MKKFAIDSPIFQQILLTPGINRQALQQLANIANTNPESNSYLSQAASDPDLRFRLATTKELKDASAGAFFDYSTKPMSIGFDPAWLVGDNAFIAWGALAAPTSQRRSAVRREPTTCVIKNNSTEESSTRSHKKF